MGSNFYLMTQNKAMAQQYAPYSYELTDEPEFGYEIHIAKTSAGWLPLFQGHKDGINSVIEYKAAYDTGEFKIYDEYGVEYNWEAIDKRVQKFNGSIRDVQKTEKINQDKTSPFYDSSCPDYHPISHIRGNSQSYKYSSMDSDDDYFTDPEGYEFSKREFS